MFYIVSVSDKAVCICVSSQAVCICFRSSCVYLDILFEQDCISEDIACFLLDKMRIIERTRTRYCVTNLRVDVLIKVPDTDSH